MTADDRIFDPPRGTVTEIERVPPGEYRSLRRRRGAGVNRTARTSDAHANGRSQRPETA
jgi:hypothetical protein